jgi:dipeptidyl aminopeptidase/acylaminoacyl peptidase
MRRVKMPRLRQGTRAAGALAVGALALTGVGLAGPARAAYLGSEGRIAFVRSGDIYSIEPTGAEVRLLAGGGHDSGPRWAPNGSRIAYLDDGNLWIMNANGSHKRQITSAAPGLTDGRPTWSPGGRYLAFVQTVRSARLGYLTRYDTVTGIHHHDLATRADRRVGPAGDGCRLGSILTGSRSTRSSTPTS